MAATMQYSSTLPGDKYDDDGKPKRTGTWITASAHIITAVIGSGVLSLAWAMAQLGWLAGTMALLIFSLITWFTCNLLADCYRSPDPTRRNSTYMEAVKSNLGGIKYKLCGVAQFGNLVGLGIGYTITSAISMGAIKKSNCFHKNGHEADCQASNNLFMIIFAVSQIILSQVPGFHKLTGLSVIAAIMSFGYSFIGIGLSVSRIAEGNHVRTSLTGTEVGVDVTKSDKMWNSLQALGNIAVAYVYSTVFVEIQDTLKSSPPENKEMRKAGTIGISVTTIFYMLCGAVGYAAFGSQAPGNFLTGFGFYEPFWLVDIGNLFIVIHLVGAYQVYCQPVYQTVESWCSNRWPENRFITTGYAVSIPLFGVQYVNVFRLIWRTLYVILTALIGMIFPFFNDMLGLLGAFSFWPLSVYFPIEMFMVQAKVKRFSFTWIWMESLSLVCFLVSVIVAVASIKGLATRLKTYQPFSSIS